MDFDNILITGGAGFIGCNLADALLTEGHCVTVFDNLSRTGAASNLEWLRQRHRRRLRFVLGDIRDYEALCKATNGTEVVYHMAAQTAVTRSVVAPREDFEVNVLGTLNVLEAARNRTHQPVVVFASTNKVYGSLAGAQIEENLTRYVLLEPPAGVDEKWPIDFHSPYGCSKGAADQYVRDYARIYNLPTVVFRQSCIYGQRQFGVEDQGWVAWFVIAAVTGKTITIYGDGKQVRDVLHVKDLVQALMAAVSHIDSTAGQIYNIGGGISNAISIWVEFGSLLGGLMGTRIEPARFEGWRSGDQPVFMCDTAKAKKDFGWEPIIGVREGVRDLFDWVCHNQEMIAAVLGG